MKQVGERRETYIRAVNVNAEEVLGDLHFVVLTLKCRELEVELIVDLGRPISHSLQARGDQRLSQAYERIKSRATYSNVEADRVLLYRKIQADDKLARNKELSSDAFGG